MIEEQILDFKKQLDFVPEVINAGNFAKKNKYILHGMGGSAIVGDVLRGVFHEINLIIHRTYGLPDFMPWQAEERLHIFSSYSGNTEEVLDAFEIARGTKLNSIIITSGGELLEKAREFGVAHIILPAGIQPRMALGYFLKAMSVIVNENLNYEIDEVIKNLDPLKFKEVGENIAELSAGKPFLIYTSNRNSAVGYIWKIKLNENAKHPAFSNCIPEANHNEIEYLEDEKARSTFFPVFVMDNEGSSRITKRMKVLMEIYNSFKIPQSAFELFGNSRLEKILGGIILADFVSIKLAKDKGVDPEKVGVLEEFKQKIKN